MEIYENGHRFANHAKWEELKNQPYDYEQEGLVKHLLSHGIVESKNPLLQYILKYYESCVVYLLKSVDILKHFHNFNWKNA